MAKSENETEAPVIAFIIKCNGKSVLIRTEDIRLGGDFIHPKPIINCPECGNRHFVELFDTVYKEEIK